MKKLFLTLAVAGVVSAAYADNIAAPVFWSENFSEMSVKGDLLDPSWTTYGNGAVPGNDINKMYFGTNNQAPWHNYILMEQGLSACAIATTTFEGDVVADQWLITPEIEVPYASTILNYTVCTYNPSYNLGSNQNSEHAYKILISTTGVEKSDFTQLTSASTGCTNSSVIEEASKWIAINGYEGKTVHLAFVVTGSNQGFTGFSNLSWGQYYVDAENLTAEVAEPGENITIDYNLKLRTPETCALLTTQLYINGELNTEKVWRKAWGTTGTSTPIQRMKFANVAVAKDGMPTDYKLVITPDYEGAQPTVIEGSIGSPKVKYPNNLVIEEITGTKCQFCPVGMGALEYYNAIYNNGKYENKCIIIGVHNTTFGPDPMAEGVERYQNALVAIDGATSLPAGIFNRAAPRGCSPVNASVAEAQFKAQSNNFAEIKSVYMPQGTTEEVIGKTAVVNFDVRNGFNSSMRNLSASVVLIENNVKGNNANYNQQNGIASTYSNGYQVAAAYKNTYGAVDAMGPYFDKYVGKGELASNPIRFDKIEYNEVARGIFPSFEGVALSQKWEEDIPQSFTIEFPIPENVMKLENTEVIVLVVNKSDQTIVASDILAASGYQDISGVSEVSSEDAVSIKAESNALRVKAEDGALVEVYTLDGCKVAAYTVVNGQLNVTAPCKGMAVVKVTGKNACKAAKLVF